MNRTPNDQLIAKYFQAFAAKDLTSIEQMFLPDVTLQDPFVQLVSSKPKVLAEYKNIFDAHKSISAETKRVYKQSEDSYCVEFELALVTNEGKNVRIDGVDCIEISNSKIKSVRAYLDVRSQG